MKPLVCSKPSRNRREQQTQFDWFWDHHNNVRPNGGCHRQVPADLYTPSSRLYPSRLPTIEYAAGFVTRKVRSSGDVNFRAVPNASRYRSCEPFPFPERAMVVALGTRIRAYPADSTRLWCDRQHRFPNSWAAGWTGG